MSDYFNFRGAAMPTRQVMKRIANANPGFLTTSLKARACAGEQGSRGAGESSCTSSFPSAPLPLPSIL